LKQKIIQKFSIGCFDPPNGGTVVINTSQDLPVDVSTGLIKRHLEDTTQNSNGDQPEGRLRLFRETLTFFLRKFVKED
jgi:hypothetical protein